MLSTNLITRQNLFNKNLVAINFKLNQKLNYLKITKLISNPLFEFLLAMKPISRPNETSNSNTSKISNFLWKNVSDLTKVLSANDAKNMVIMARLVISAVFCIWRKTLLMVKPVSNLITCINTHRVSIKMSTIDIK